MNKTRRCTGTLRASIRLKCNFIFIIKKIFFFFNQSGTFPFRIFGSWFDPNATIKWLTKVQKRQSTLRLREREMVTRRISDKNTQLWRPTNCGTMLAIRCVGLSECQSEDPVVFLVRNPHKELASEISHETGRGRGKEDPKVRERQNREVNRAGQSTGESSRQKSGEADGRERWLLESVDWDAGLDNMRRWDSIPGGFVGISLEYTLALAHRMIGTYHRFHLSCAWS